MPSPPVYEQADPELVKEVVAALGLNGNLQRLQNAGGPSSTFLKMDAEDSHVRFIKVIGADRTLSLQAAEELARWLQSAGVRVVAAETSVEIPEGRRLWVYPYHAGRPPQPCVEDMSAIGSELGRLHQALRRHPSIGEWREQTAARMVRLSTVREALAEGAIAAGPEPGRLQSIACDRSIDFLPVCYAPMEDSLALHGDLNRFNMLLDERGCTFLDFEDICHSVMPAIFDLATVAERVAMLDQTPSVATHLTEVLFDAYASVTRCRPTLEQVPEVLRGLALRSLCTLAEIDPEGQDIQEWQKFFHLLSDAEKRHGKFSTTGNHS